MEAKLEANKLSAVPVSQVFTCKNPRCRAVLGTTDGFVLIIAGLVRIEVTIPFFCWQCEQKMVWRPRDWVGRNERRERRLQDRTTWVQPKSSAITAQLTKQREKCPTC